MAVDDTNTTAEGRARCLDDSTVLRFMAGQLDDTARRLVEDELGRCRDCSALVAELIRGSAALHVEASELEVPGADPVLSRYVLGPVIARGGMGTILAAFDRRLSRSVAVKRMDGSAHALVERFRREIRVTASLQHPGIVPIYDAGVLDDGQPFYAMRHVPGASFDHAMAECDDGKRLGLLVPVLAATEAVAYAHARGIIHRDLKPSNILVGPFGETVVIDWGLAAIDEAHEASHAGARSEAVERDAMTTSDGSVLGTPRFMAPEQARGEPATLRSDVYALGGILYHALSGVSPVPDGTVTEVLERVARAEVRPLRDVAPGLPGDLVAIVERAMALAPEARYASCGELAADLRRFQTGQLVAAHRYSRGELVRRFARRHRAALVFAALLVAILGVGGTLSVRRIVVEREHAEAERGLAQRERSGAEQLVKFLLFELRARLSTVGRLDILSGVADHVDAYYLTTVAGRAEAPEAVRERAALHDLRAAVASAAGDGASAERYIARGLEMLDRAPAGPATDEVRGDLTTSQARRAGQIGDFARARALFLAAVALYRKAPAGEDPEHRHQRELKLAGRLSNAATMAERLNQLPDAEREWQEAADLLQARLAQDPEDFEAGTRLCELRMTIGQRRYRRGLVDTAEPSLRAALADGERLAARRPKDTDVEYLVAWSALALANVRYGQGDLDGAVKLRKQALAVAAMMLAVEPASVVWQVIQARGESDLGMVALDRLDWAEAAQRFGAARTINEQLVALDPKSREHRRDAAIAAAQVAEAETWLGRFDAARAAWVASLADFEVRARGNEPEPRLDWAFGLRGYAGFERQHGRLAAAATAIDQAIALVDGTAAGADLPVMIYYRAAVLTEAGTVRDLQGQRDAAIAAWQRAVTLLRGVAKRVPLEQEWEKTLHEAEAGLARRGARGAR